MQSPSPADAAGAVKLTVGIPSAEPEGAVAAEHLEVPVQLAGGGTWKDAG